MANAKSLRQSRRRPNANTAAAMNAFRDAIFEEHCGDKCLSVLRIVYSLRHYHLLLKAKKKVDNDRTLFIEWCDSVYTAALLLDDYVHVMSKHNDMASLSAMARQIKCPCSGAAECEWTGRHFRGRERDKKKKNAESVHFYIELMDTLHFNIFHLKEVGLRVDLADAKTSDDDDGDDEDTLVDAAMLRARDIIKLKRKEYAFDRMHSTEISKFTIVGTQKEHDDEGKQMMMESMLEYINAENVTGFELLQRYVAHELYDSEGIELEVNLFCNDGASQSNLLRFAELHALPNLKKAIANFLREFRASKSFSTGIIFWYWPWHREAENQTQIRRECFYENMDFGGHSISDLCVRPRFASLKEEAMESGEVDIEEFNATVVEKAERYLKTRKCRAMRSRFDDLHFGLHAHEGVDEYYDSFRIPLKSPLSLRHIQSVLLYTDFTHFSKTFSSSFRKLRWNESIREINQRNARFFHIAKALRECVYLFGCDNATNKFRIGQYDGSGPFFTGVSVVVNIPSFAINLQGPTSTSKQYTVALRFAKDDGLILRLDNNGECGSDCVSFWDASWTSRYPEEDERIFFASNHKLKLEAIFVVNTAKNFQDSVCAFFKFDQILSGDAPIDVSETRELKNYTHTVTAREVRIVTQSINVVLGRPNKQTLDEFVIHNFMAFTRKKTRVVLDLEAMYQCGETALTGLVVYPMDHGQEVDGTIPDDDTNCIRPLLFELFPNLTQITIESGFHSFNFLSLLRILKSVELPAAFKGLTIKGHKWIRKALQSRKCDEVVEAYDAENLRIVLDDRRCASILRV